MTDRMYILVFIFAGLAWAGALALGLLVFAGIRRLRTPKPPDLTEPTEFSAEYLRRALPPPVRARHAERGRWEREWSEIEKNLSK